MPSLFDQPLLNLLLKPLLLTELFVALSLRLGPQHLLGQQSQLLDVRHHHGHDEVLGGLSVDEHVVDEGAGAEDGLDATQGDVLAGLELHQVLLTVCQTGGIVGRVNIVELLV